MTRPPLPRNRDDDRLSPNRHLSVRFDTANLSEIDRRLADLRRQLMHGSPGVVVFDFPSRVDAAAGQAGRDWLDRNRDLLAARATCFAVVARGFWSALAIKLDLMGDPPPTRWAVHRSIASAARWASSA